MATVANLPEKRYLDKDLMTEDQSDKRQKLDDDIEEPPERTYCSICDLITFHSIDNCPHRARAIGRYCLICTGPCTQNEKGEHGLNIIVMMKRCCHCLCPGLHWSQECPDEKKVGKKPESTGKLSDDDSF